MKQLFKVPRLEFTDIKTSSYTQKNIRLQVARLDKLHEVVSGNKLFKLHFFLEQALQSNHKTILTFGGAWSNHLLATAYACKLAGLKSIGLVRGDQATKLSNTLKNCDSYGMHLKYISRDHYENKDLDHFKHELYTEFGECLIVPEGGYHPLGAMGAALIMDHLQLLNPTHICTAIGTATTFAGLAQHCLNNEVLIGVPVLKNMTDIPHRVSTLNNTGKILNHLIFDAYHFGGYAKKTNELFRFMNELYMENNLPTDFVYTGKMMYAVLDKIKQDFFAEGSNIICLHTGGLQGNASLAAGTLVF